MWILALILANLSFIVLNSYAFAWIHSLVFDRAKWWMYLLPILTIILSTASYVLSACFICDQPI